MGSAASKSARATSSTVRRYPSRPPPAATRARAAPPPPTTISETIESNPQHPQTSSRTTTQTQTQQPPTDPDARDPLLAARLNSLGTVQPNPHYSPSSISALDPQLHSPHHSSTHDSPDMPSSLPASAFPNPAQNPALRLLEARARIAEEAEEELTQAGRKGFEGRKYVDAGAVQLALMRRARGDTDQRIEEAVGLKKGRLAVLGGKGVVDAVR